MVQDFDGVNIDKFDEFSAADVFSIHQSFPFYAGHHSTEVAIYEAP